MTTRNTPIVQVERYVCDDEVDPRYGKEIGTLYICGEGKHQVEVDVREGDPNDVPFVFGAGLQLPLHDLQRILPNLITLMSDPRLAQHLVNG